MRKEFIGELQTIDLFPVLK